MKKRLVSLLGIMLIIFSIIPTVYASETTLNIASVTGHPGGTVDVPITISGNPGIAGAVIKISYDSNLQLAAVTVGEAFSTLVFTPPAKLTSNPITLLWDGVVGDVSNGTIVTLTFIVPDNANGMYNISAWYDVGGIYDGDLEDIAVQIVNGGINVSSDAQETETTEIAVSGESEFLISLSSPETISGAVYAALYDANGKMIELNTYPAKASITATFQYLRLGKYVKVMWWKNCLTPVCEYKKIELP